MLTQVVPPTLPPIVALSMPQQLAVTNPATAPAVSGAIAGNGSIDELSRFLAAAAGSKLPYGGDYAFKQNLQNQGDTVTIVGDLTAKKFTVKDATDPKKEAFNEPEVAVRNDLSADLNHVAANI